MGFYIKKSVSVGPFRFNLSKSGIGVSAGITGLRLGKGPRGTYVHAGRGGVYYRKTLSSEPTGVLFHPKLPAEAQDTQQPSDLEVVDSGSVLRMVDAKSADVLQELNYRPHSYESILAVICAVAVITGIFVAAIPWWLSCAAAAVALFVMIVLQQRSSMRKTIAILYNLEPEVEQSYTRLHEIFDEFKRADGIWHVEARGSTIQGVRRKRISVTTGLPPLVRSNLEAPMIPVGKQTLFFFPDIVLVHEDGTFGAVSYQQLAVDVTEPQSLNEGKTSSDACAEEIHFSSNTGLNEVIQVSRQGMGAKLRSALIELGEFSGEIKADIH